MPGHQTHFYNPQQQPSPEDSIPATPNNISPTSPKDNFLKYYLPNQVRQLRPPKSPLYVPAALRPTERNPRPSPMTPPKSLHGSLDSLDGAFDTRMGSEAQPSLDQFRHAFMVEEELGEVSGPPTRQHWKVSTNPRFTRNGWSSLQCPSATFRVLADVRTQLTH